ncbi:MAG: hypothetical protein HDS70_00015 [Bacteroidales bacterium]|nr:hypothetical protein [Bacteroidales bacterium]
MKHTDFYKQYKFLDGWTEAELKAAIKAHGSEYVFIHTDEDDDERVSEEKNNAPIISASTKWMESYEDFYVSRVVIEEGDHLVVFGFPKEGWADDEQELTSISHGQLEFVIDEIAETDNVQDVTIP